MSYRERIAARLGELEAAGLRRSVARTSPSAAGDVLDFSSNDYLGLARHPEVVAALSGATCAGSGGARLLAGAHESHCRLEEELAILTGRERALLFSSGYHAALGAIRALSTVVARVASDRLNHASLIDGMRLSRLPVDVYEHRTIPHMHEAPTLVVTETVFGVDGDAADVGALVRTLREDDVLLVDEAHALGVCGPHGGGLAHGIDDPRIVVMGTLSKALGAHGGFIAGPAGVIEYLVSTARTFIFDTALPPAIADAATVALRLARADDEGRRRLREHVETLVQAARRLGFTIPGADGAIVPIVVGDVEKTMQLAARLRERGINAPPIRPPTVPAGTSRLRITLRATHTKSDVERLTTALAAVR